MKIIKIMDNPLRNIFLFFFLKCPQFARWINNLKVIHTHPGHFILVLFCSLIS